VTDDFATTTQDATAEDDLDGEALEPTEPGRPDFASIADARAEPRPPLSAQEIDPTRLPLGERSDSFCSIAWLVDRFEVVMIFGDPALTDREQEICEAMNTLTSTHRSLDELVRGVNRWAEGAGLSASIYDDVDDEDMKGVLAVSFEIG